MVVFPLSEYLQILFRSYHAGQLNAEHMSKYPHKGILPVNSLKIGKIWAN